MMVVIAPATVRPVSAASRARANVGPTGSDKAGQTRAVAQKHAHRFPQQAVIGVWTVRNTKASAFRSGANALAAWLGERLCCSGVWVTRVSNDGVALVVVPRSAHRDATSALGRSGSRIPPCFALFAHAEPLPFKERFEQLLREMKADNADCEFKTNINEKTKKVTIKILVRDMGAAVSHTAAPPDVASAARRREQHQSRAPGAIQKSGQLTGDVSSQPSHSPSPSGSAQTSGGNKGGGKKGSVVIGSEVDSTDDSKNGSKNVKSDDSKKVEKSQPVNSNSSKKSDNPVVKSSNAGGSGGGGSGGGSAGRGRAADAGAKSAASATPIQPEPPSAPVSTPATAAASADSAHHLDGRIMAVETLVHSLEARLAGKMDSLEALLSRLNASSSAPRAISATVPETSPPLLPPRSSSGGGLPVSPSTSPVAPQVRIVVSPVQGAVQGIPFLLPSAAASRPSAPVLNSAPAPTASAAPAAVAPAPAVGAAPAAVAPAPAAPATEPVATVAGGTNSGAAATVAAAASGSLPGNGPAGPTAGRTTRSSGKGPSTAVPAATSS